MTNTAPTSQCGAMTKRILPVLGVVLMLLGTFLHPMHADPADPAAAFAEYAADKTWLFSHLVQFIGVAALLISLLHLTQSWVASLPVVAIRAGAVASLALAAALQAVDGVALKQMVDHWTAAAADTGANTALLAASIAVRSVEIGFAALFGIVLGLTLAALGLMLFRLPRSQPVLGGLGIAGGLAVAGGGVLTGQGGFTELPMLVNMGASLFVLGWYLVVVWRMDRP